MTADQPQPQAVPGGAPPLTVVQVLPALNAGGVERGTVEFARELVKLGHRAVVISSGGRQVEALTAAGCEHITMPVHRKSLASLKQVRPMRQLLETLGADIVHVRSRVPAWIVWLAWRKMPRDRRPGLVSTFHGLYSVNAYSGIMARAQQIIAISHCVQDYIFAHYKVDPSRVTLIPRGLDPDAFSREPVSRQWQQSVLEEYPALGDKHIILMPGRLSRWKGQEAFLHMMARLITLRPDCHGVIVGEAEPDKQHYLQELMALRHALGLQEHVSFLGHRSDIGEFYRWASVTCHMSNKPEPFGRTVPESLASGTPVVAYDRGGASESLQQGFPQGLVPPDDVVTFAARIADILDADNQLYLPEAYYLQSQVTSTLGVYQRLLADNP